MIKDIVNIVGKVKSGGYMLIEKLEPGMTGSYLVTTQSSQHIWNLDTMEYTRLPGEYSPLFDYDGNTVKLNYVEVWPEVGGRSSIVYDDLLYPDSIEQWRISSTIASIEKIDENTTIAYTKRVNNEH
jgi:hypothetical protein